TQPRDLQLPFFQSPSLQNSYLPNCMDRTIQRTRNRMKTVFLAAMLLFWTLLSHLAAAQASPKPFPLAGDWEGTFVFQGTTGHVLLHMNTTPEGKMTA